MRLRLFMASIFPFIKHTCLIYRSVIYSDISSFASNGCRYLLAYHLVQHRGTSTIFMASICNQWMNGWMDEWMAFACRSSVVIDVVWFSFSDESMIQVRPRSIPRETAPRFQITISQSLNSSIEFDCLWIELVVESFPADWPPSDSHHSIDSRRIRLRYFILLTASSYLFSVSADFK